MSYIPAAKMPHAGPASAIPAPASSPRVPVRWLALGGLVAGAGLALLAGSVRR